MTDLSTKTLKRLLDEATPGPWTVKTDDWDETIIANDEGHRMGWGDQVRFKFEAGHSKYDSQVVALAPELLAEVIRKREALHDLSEVWEAISIDPTRTPAEQQLAAAVVDHIDQILGDHDD